MEGSTTVIEMRGLTKRFAQATAVAGIDLDVPGGGVYGFLGPNGAGKTTTIRVIVGLLWPSRGTTRIFGEPVSPGAPVLRRVGSLIERPAFYPYLSARDNLRVFGTAHGLADDLLVPRTAEALDRVGLTAAARRRVGGFSTGMRQRLALATALIGRPELVVLDEPTNGLDPNGVVDVRELIARLSADGTTVLLSSHVLPEVEQLCDRVAILREGRVVAEGPTADLLAVGERVVVRFDTADEAARAAVLLGAVASSTNPTTLLVDVPSTEASGLNRRLGGASLYPAELSVRRQSLEAVFRELTSDPATPAPVASPPAATPPAVPPLPADPELAPEATR